MRALVLLSALAIGCSCSGSEQEQPAPDAQPQTSGGSSGSAGSTGGTRVSGGTGGGAGTGGSGATAATSGAGGTAGRATFDCEHVQVVKSCENGWCRIPAGCFVMGSPESEWGRGANTESQAKVTLTRAFEIQQFEVTQTDWVARDLPNPSTPPVPGSAGDCLEAACPVGNVTWYEAAAYANLLSAERVPPLAACYELSGCSGEVGTGMTCAAVSMTAPSPYACDGYRLPTAAEWEYAARAGTVTAFYSGPITEQSKTNACAEDPNLDQIGWYCANSGNSTHQVGGKQPNAWGIHDMSGNAHEWTNDVTDGIGHGPGPLVDPDESGAFPLSQVLTRGGGPNTYPAGCRSAKHSFALQRTSRGPGFRLVRTLPITPDAAAD